MNESRRQEIIIATLNLASQKGLGAVSMNMIAESVGIKKPSLYNHFKSKDELVNAMYEFLRKKASENVQLNFDPEFFENNSAFEILYRLVENYITLCSDKNIEMFYKVIYSERAISRVASKIMINETEKMISATKNIFGLLQAKKKLKFSDEETCATAFALTIHSMMDYLADVSFCESGEVKRDTSLIKKYISLFCKEHEFKE